MAWLDELFRTMVSEGASDLHLSTDCVPKFRLHGDMVDVPGQEPIDARRMSQILEEITPVENQNQFDNQCDTDFAYELEGVARFRSNLFMDLKGPGAVFRQIPSEVLTAEQLELPKVVTDLCYLSKGLVLVTGPTGSGKSTTLAAMIDHINKHRSDHIITIEDPVEFVHQNQRCLINQREVHRHTKGFKQALRAALREDPDVVLVGEMRDLETIEIAIETAETGHLVFGTLHTSTAPSTVDRIIDQFPADRQAQIRTMLSSSLKGVIAQTLCKKKPKGRVAALEILIGNTAVAANIREGKTHQIVSVMQTGAAHGMRLLNDSLLELVKADIVEPHEAYVKAVNKDDIKTKFAQNGIALDLTNISNQSAAPAPAAAPNPLQTKPAPAASAPPRPALPGQAAPARPQAPARPKPPAGGGSPGYQDPFEQFKRQQGR
jgi:twitching motility protein PilT